MPLFGGNLASRPGRGHEREIFHERRFCSKLFALELILPSSYALTSSRSRRFYSSCFGALLEIMNARFDEEPRRKRLKQSSIEESFNRHRTCLKSKASLHLPGRYFVLVSRQHERQNATKFCCQFILLSFRSFLCFAYKSDF